MVFICAISLLMVVQHAERALRGLGLISRHSLGIYGFHALVIYALRSRGVDLKNWAVLDILWVFAATLAGSLLLSLALQRIRISAGWSADLRATMAASTVGRGFGYFHADF
ncbi:hypothetical protein ACNKHO_22675 [Shigella flexneri]